MTHRGPFQPRPFCDSVGGSSRVGPRTELPTVCEHISRASMGRMGHLFLEPGFTSFHAEQAGIAGVGIPERPHLPPLS